MKWAWLDQALCRGADANLWFPDSHHTEQAAAAKRVCMTCPVRAECLEAHLGENDGVWGGMSVNERKRERKRRRNMEAAA